MEKYLTNFRRGEIRMIAQGFWDGLTPPQAYLRQLLLEHELLDFEAATQFLKKIGPATAPLMLETLRGEENLQIALIEQMWVQAPPLVLTTTVN